MEQMKGGHQVANMKKPVRNPRGKKPKPDNGAKKFSNPTSLKTANENLKEQVQKLQTQCKNYRELLQQLIPAPFTPDDLLEFTKPVDETKCQPLEQFVGELEAIFRNTRKKGA
jgi:hypothetical protein